ncbi:unnamed protein product [Arabis nemorensis]|uniref:At2g29880-like C-terminal domain-containing protein n=1 Tax=Arabis nemorensis TaxID=586526 RepID=A0A565BAA5_9BRAS|nr:unnamed protein product [Arabis nemorensis]
MKAHPTYKTFRNETFEEFDNLKVIFGNNIATGGNAIGLCEGTDARTSEAQKEQTNYVEDFSMNVENDHETSTLFWSSNSKASSEKLPLRKRQRTNNINNAGEPIIQREDGEQGQTEMNSLTTVTQNLFDLIQEREARQQRETEEREAEKKKNNVWEAIKEVSDFEENVRYDAVKVIHQLGMEEVFVSMSIDERYGWIKRNVTS